MARPELRKPTSEYFDDWEVLSPKRKQDPIRRALFEIIEWAKTHSNFYRERLNEFQPNAASPLEKIPILLTSDLRAHIPPTGFDLLTSKSQAFTVFQSGGTTGVPKTSLFTDQEMEGINECNARGFHAVGLNSSDRVANLWAVGGLYMTFVHMHRILQSYGCMNFPFSNQTPADFIYNVAKLFKINCFTGIASVVLSTLRKIREHDKDFRIQKVFFGGEHIYEADRLELERDFGAEMIAAPGYGTVDSWYIGYQCLSCSNGIFHVFDSHVFAEILDDDLKSTSGIGMLYVTAFHRRLTPIIRYRVGDRAEWLKEDCPCGRTAPRFQLLGRGDDVLRIGYDSVDYEAVQSIVSQIPGLSGRIQMEKQREQGKDQLILRIETQAPAEELENLRQKLNENFLESRPSFRDFVKKGTVLPLKIELLPFNSLPQNSRTGKLIRIIDAL